MTTISEYDNHNQLIRSVDPDGAVATYSYDSLNRLTLLENRKTTGEIISSYAYTLAVETARVGEQDMNSRVYDLACFEMQPVLCTHVGERGALTISTTF